FGLDIAPRMVEIASNNAPGSLVKAIDPQNIPASINRDSPFGFVHSTLVLQHVRPSRGLEIIDHLLKATASGGRALIQVPPQVLRKSRYLLNQIRYINPTLFKVSRLLLRDKDWGSVPLMEMNSYPLNKIIQLCDSNRIKIHWIKSSIDSDRYLL